MSEVRLPELSARLWVEGAPRKDLVTRVCAALRAEIQGRDLAAGTRLPSEATLAREMRISRPTLREATRVLAQEGLLDIRHGVGTFVAPGSPPLRSAIDAMSSLTSAIRAAGGEPRVRSLTIDNVEPPHDVAEALRLGPGQRVARINRVRLIDDRPLGLAFEYLPIDAPAPFATLQTFDGTSLYRFLTETVGIALLRSEMSVTAVSATTSQARLLAVKTGAPLLLMRETHVGHGDRRVLHSVNYHNSAIIDLTLERAGVRA